MAEPWPCPASSQPPCRPARNVGPIRHARRASGLDDVLVARGPWGHVELEPVGGADLVLDRMGDLGMLLQEGLGVLAPLPDALVAVGEPRARLLDDTRLHPEVDKLASLRDALAVHDVELDLLERRGDLVLDDFHTGLVADHLVAVLDRADAADVEADRGIELQRVAA